MPEAKRDVALTADFIRERMKSRAERVAA
jgi:hypothetical protein